MLFNITHSCEPILRLAPLLTLVWAISIPAGAVTVERTLNVNLLESSAPLDTLPPLGEPESLAFTSLSHPSAQFTPALLGIGDTLHLNIRFRGVDSRGQRARFVDYPGTANQLINFGPTVVGDTSLTARVQGITQYRISEGQLLIPSATNTRNLNIETTPSLPFLFGSRGNHTNTQFSLSGIDFRMTVRDITGSDHFTATGINLQLFATENLSGPYGSLFVESVPEPTTLALVMLVTMATLSRRR